MIRRATLADLESIVSIEKTFSADAFSRRSLRYFISKDATLVLYLDRVAGYSIVTIRTGSDRARLYSIAIESETRGKGYGIELLKASEEYAITLGAKYMTLEVDENNTVARHLYCSKGYKAYKLLPEYYENGENALRMVKPLIYKE
jgi:ribosomal protein S18 acetylase RimI-like enzyme